MVRISETGCILKVESPELAEEWDLERGVHVF